MYLIACPRCGSLVKAAAPDGVAVCTNCAAAIEVRPILASRAIEEMRASLRRHEHLPEDLHRSIEQLLDVHAQTLRATPTVLPPPLPPPLPPRTAPLAAGEVPPPLPPGALSPRPASSQPPAPTGPLAAPPSPFARPPPFARPSPAAPPSPFAPRGPSLWTRLGPAFTENILFALAAFLLVAGAVYFVTTAWTTMTGEQRLLVVVGGIELLGVVLFAAGRLLNRGGNLPEVERVLLVVTGFLVPVAAAAAGELLSASLLLGILASAAVLGPGFFAARSLAKLSEPRLFRSLPIALTAVCVAILPAHLLGRFPAAAGAAGAAVMLSALALHLLRAAPTPPARLAPAIWSSLLVAFAGIVLAGILSLSAWRAGTGPGTIFGPLGIAAAAAGAGAALLGARVARDRSVPFSAVAVALAIGGTVIALGDERALLAAAALGTAAALASGLRLPVPALLLPGLALAAVAYLHLPAPVRALASAVRDRAAGALGYEPRALPLAYYGLTFLPFVAASGLFALRLRARAAGHARVALGFTVAAAAGLCLLAIAASRGDLRAPAAVLPAEGALLLLLAIPARDRRFVLAGSLLVFGGLSFALHRLGPTTGTHLLAMGGAGLLAVGAAGLLRPRGGFAGAAADALSDAAAMLAGVTAVVLALGSLPGADRPPMLISLSAPGATDLPGAAALAALLFVLAASYRRPEPALAGALVLARAAAGAVVGLGLAPADAWRAVVFAAAAAPLVLLDRPLRSAPEALRRRGLREADPALLLPAGLLGLTAFGLAEACHALVEEMLTWHQTAGLLLAAGVLAAAAVRSRQAFAAGVAALVFLLAGAATGGALSLDAFGTEAACGVAAAVAILAAAARGAERGERTRAVLSPALGVVAVCAAGPVLFWLLLRFLDGALGAEPGAPTPDAALLAAAALIAAAGLRLARGGAAGFLSGLFPGVAALALVRWLGGSHDLYPLALGVAAAAALATSRGRGALHAAAVVLSAASLATATGMALDDGGRAAPLLAAFLLAAALGRALAPRRPRAGGALLLVALLGAVTLGLWHCTLDWPARWQPSVILGFTALALLAPRVKALAVSPVAARGVALPILLVAGVALLCFAGSVAVEEWSTRGTPDPRLPATAAAAAFVLAAAIFARGFRPLGRAVTTLSALALATFVLAPVNIAIAGAFDHWRRPDVEVALCGLLLAAVLPGERGRKAPVPYAFAAVALLLTAGDFRHLSTPLALLAISATALVLLVRDDRRIHGDLGAFGLLATVLAFTVWAVPESGRPAHEILVALSLAAALALLLLLGFARLFRLRIDPARAEAAAPCFARAGAVAAVASIAFLLLNVLSLPWRQAEADLAICAAAAMVVTAGASLVAACAPGRAHLVHATTAALLALYAFFSARTGVLDLLRGHHAATLAVFGAGLIVASACAGGRFAKPLGIDGLLLPIPAVFWAVLGLADFIGTPGPAAAGFFLAAAAYGIGAVRFRRRAFGVLAAVLLNLALFALWRARGIVDPAFYGVPPGLTLLLAAEALRGRADPAARLGLFLPGAALLYGSVGLQVLRVEEPAHALVLFGLGLLAVVVGFARSRNEFLVAGTTVVVLDVIAYLAKHGLEEGFLGAVLLVLAGLTVLTVGTLAALRRRRAPGAPEGRDPRARGHGPESG